MYKRLLIFFIFLIATTSVQAQRVSYPQLVYRSQLPEIFIDDIILPGENGETTLAFIFRFNHDFLPFKKIPLNNNLNAPNDANFYSTIRLNAEIFKGSSKNRNAASMAAVSRDIWSDTLFVADFEDTQTDEQFASGSMSTTLEPGMYNYLLQLVMMQEVNERSTQRQNIQVPDLTDKITGEIVLVQEVQDFESGKILPLINLDDNVPFGEDFHALIRIPDYEENNNYRLTVNEATISRRDTSAGKSVHEHEINSDEIFTSSTIRLNKGSNPSLTLIQNEEPFTYAIVHVPHKTFQNAPYLIHIYEEGNEEAIAETFFRSYWPDMPASLYNLNIAIDMLSYIVSDNELKRLKSGSDKEKEQKFREFWESRDPTPETVYNELMAEFYRRIDYSFKEFGSQENPMGHESDQGEVYIKFGPPQSKDRQFPTDGNVREVWKYPNRTFIFEATTGFGDYKLVGSR